MQPPAIDRIVGGATEAMAMQTQVSRLAASDLDRLAKLCGLFGSSHGGERANAAALADKLVRERGLTWFDVIGAPTPAAGSNGFSRTGNDDELFGEWSDGWRGAVAHCISHGRDVLTPFERNFLHNVSAYRHAPSDKQKATLKAMLDKMSAAGERAA